MDSGDETDAALWLRGLVDESLAELDKLDAAAQAAGEGGGDVSGAVLDTLLARLLEQWKRAQRSGVAREKGR